MTQSLMFVCMSAVMTDEGQVRKPRDIPVLRNDDRLILWRRGRTVSGEGYLGEGELCSLRD